MRQIDWEERCWQLTHDLAVRLALEANDAGTDPAAAAGEAVMAAEWTCAVYREVAARKPGTAKQTTGEGV